MSHLRIKNENYIYFHFTLSIWPRNVHIARNKKYQPKRGRTTYDNDNDEATKRHFFSFGVETKTNKNKISQFENVNKEIILLRSGSRDMDIRSSLNDRYICWQRIKITLFVSNTMRIIYTSSM